MKKSLTIVFCVLCTKIGVGQNTPFIYSDVPSELLSTYHSPNSLSSKDTDRFYHLVHSLPENYVTDGSVDYTKVVQAAMDSCSNLIFPPFPLMIDSVGLKVSSNSHIVFPDGSLLILKPNGQKRYNILELHEVNNVTLIGPKIVGDRDDHTALDGEWGMRIGIRGSKNISIFFSDIKDCWGDGIYIGKMNSRDSENIVIHNSRIDNCRRNGISITSARNVNVSGALISNINGTPPMYGIDIEANNNDDNIEEIVLKDIVTYNNVFGGVLIGLNKLVGANKKNISIVVDNHYDYKSYIGLRVGGISAKQRGQINGNIKIINPRWKSNQTPFRRNSFRNTALKVELFNPVIEESRRKAFTVEELRRTLKANQNIFLY